MSKHREWSPPQGLIIQPGAILVPGRVGYVPASVDPMRYEIREPALGGLGLAEIHSRAGVAVSGKDGRIVSHVEPVSIPRWDLSSLTMAELDSLQVAIEAQRSRGIGQPCPATEADRRALGEPQTSSSPK